MESVKNLYWPSRRTPSQFLALTEEHTNIKNLIEFFSEIFATVLGGRDGRAGLLGVGHHHTGLGRRASAG